MDAIDIADGIGAQVRRIRSLSTLLCLAAEERGADAREDVCSLGADVLESAAAELELLAACLGEP